MVTAEIHTLIESDTVPFKYESFGPFGKELIFLCSTIRLCSLFNIRRVNGYVNQDKESEGLRDRDRSLIFRT